MRLTLFYAARFYRNGAGYHVQPAYGKYVEALARKVDELVMCAPVADREVPGSGLRLEGENIRVVPLPYYQRDIQAVPTVPRALPGIDRALEGADLASVMLPLGVMGPLIYARARRKGVPLFMHVVGDLREQWSPKDYGPLSRVLYGMVVEGIEHVQQRMIHRTFTFAQGVALRRKHEGGPAGIAEAMETTIMAEDVREQGRLMPEAPPRLLYAGNLIRPKGVHVLLEAMAELRRRGIETSADVLGTGPYQPELEAMTGTLGLSDRVRFRGFQDLPGVLSFMDRSTLFVFPSFGEGMPRVLLEAMARGLPVVTTAVGGIPGVVRHGVNGWLVPPGSVTALADGVARMLGDRDLWEAVSRAGLETARQHTMDHYADLMVRELRRRGLWPGA